MNEHYMESQLNPLEQCKSMTEEETHAFLKKMGVVPFDIFTPHVPILYVMEEYTKGDTGPFKNLPRDKRPCIARVDDPINLDSQVLKFDDEQSTPNASFLENGGGRVDYYTIDAKTGEVSLVLPEKETEFKVKSYAVLIKGLYKAQDNLFPKGKE